MAQNSPLRCHLCGQEHRSVQLKPGEKAVCSRCDTLLAIGPRFGPDAPLCFAVTGLILAVPAALLPFVGAEKLGDERFSLLLTGVGALWDGGMRALSVLVLLCGEVLPIALLVILTALHAPARFGRPWAGAQILSRVAEVLGNWAIPEVQVLAVLVAVVKLGSLVDLTIGPGFWCYCGMALALLLAQHGFAFASPDPAESSAVAAAPRTP